jgi:hypothetical protein
MNIGVADILKKVSEMKTKKERVEYLRKSYKEKPTYLAFLKYMFKSSIQFDLPSGPAETVNGVKIYKPNPKEMDLQNVLYNSLKKIKIFMRGEYSNMSKTKREALFVELLENVDPDDAEFLIAMKDKRSPYPHVTKKLIQDAFPEQTKDW